MKKCSFKLGIVVMAIGILMLLGQLGIHVGWLFALIIPTFFVYKGWKLFTRSESSFKKGLGVILMIIGLLWLTGMLHVIIGLAIAGFLIYYGLKMIKNPKSVQVVPEFSMNSGIKESFYESAQFNDYDELDEWEKEINKK